jgi:CheY-like chemotaxis protein
MRAKELTAKLLTFASGGDPVKATASLPDLVRDAVGFVLLGSDVKCDFQIPDDLWSVSMDKDQIRQVIQDLVRNANQSMPEGGTILISFANMKLEDNEVVGLYPGRYVRVCLTDRGRGIEGENLERVFDPYFSTKEKDSNKGSGLGLAIVHSIVNRHDGRISVDSIPGKGTTFTLYLPARLVESFELPRRSAIIPSGKGIVLVLDDDQDIQEIVGEMLLHIGYKAQPAFNGREAVKLYRDFYEAGTTRFCAVIMDLNTQGELVGREVLSGLLEIDPGARVIASCEDSADPIVDNYLAYGFCSLIVKPYKLLELNGLMSSVCNIKSSTDSARQKISSLKN